MIIKKYIQLKGFCLFLFIILMNIDGLAQAGLNENGKLDNNAANVVDKYGAKGSGFARTIYGEQFSKPLGSLAICDGSQPTAVVETTSATGRVWMDRNIGASRAATSATDFEAFGCLYQWGRGNDGHATTLWTSSTSGTLVNGTTNQSFTAASPPSNLYVIFQVTWFDPLDPNNWVQGSDNDPCPTGFYVPSAAELRAEKDLGNLSYEPTLKMPLSPFRGGDGILYQNSRFWTGDYFGNNQAYLMGVNYDNHLIVTSGANVRCIKEVSPAICDGTQPTTVVAVTSTTGQIWMDRNLGASRAATSDTDFEAFGCLYQWGRGNDGHASTQWTSATEGTIVNGTTTTQQTSTSPESNLFVLNSNWLNPNDNNLWQGVDGKNNPCPAGYRIPSLAELNLERDEGYLNYGPILKAPLVPNRGAWDGKLETRQMFWTADYNFFTANYASLLGRLDSGTASKGSGLSVRCIKN